MTPVAAAPAAAPATVPRVAGAVLLGLTVSHLLNDLMQSLVVAIYPMLRDAYGLSFGQIGLITLTNQITASLLQPIVGAYTDRRPASYALSVGMIFTFAGILLLAAATTLPLLLVAAALVGVGSSVFHPEASRIARLASGGRHGFAQSVFQVGGNLGSSLGPLVAALVVLPRGQGSVGWFSAAALAASAVLLGVGRWYGRHRAAQARAPRAAPTASVLPRRVVVRSLVVLGVLVFSKYVYLAGLTNYYAFYLTHRFGVSLRGAQLELFAFLFAVAAGTVLGGPIGDRIGRKRVIWASILGVAPFTLALPYVGLVTTSALAPLIGFVLASAFSAILVYAQELVPGRVGTVSGLFFGLAFGVAGIAAAALGRLADATSLETVYRICAFLPLLGALTALLPDLERRRAERPAHR